MRDEDSLPGVSVIVPICNVQDYLDQCLLSVRNQTYQNIEIICLNDGSSDGSSAIMHKHAKADNRIVCIDKENEGYGATCNRGLDMARGEYVAIVEPDDYLLPDMFKDMLALNDDLGGGIDVLKTPWINLFQWDDPATLREKPSILHKTLSTSRSPFKLSDAPVLIEGHPSIWSALYRRAFLNEKKIRFREYPGAGWADNPFLIDTLCQADTIAYLDRPYYCYRTELPGSTKNHATEEKVALPFDRWLDMTEEMHRLGVCDKGIWCAHALRGFNYVDGAIKDDGWDNEVVQRKTRELFEHLPEEYVIGCRKLSAAKKRFYYDVLGKPAPKLSNIPYMGHLVTRAINSVRSMGFGALVGEIGNFAKNKVNGVGIEKAERKE